MKTRFRSLRVFFSTAAVLAASLLLVSVASATVEGTVSTGSSGNVTISLNGLIFNTDPAAVGGGNSDVASGTSLTFAGCASGVLGSPGCLSTAEGITVNNNDLLTLTPPSTANANTFLTFAAHPSLVFSSSSVGPGSTTTNCSTANANGLSCSIFAGSPIILTYLNGHTSLSLGVVGRASDTGVGGLATASTYNGGFSGTFTATLTGNPVGKTAPTPEDIQLYFCPSGTCIAADFTSGKTITTSQSGDFTATITSTTITPEPASMMLFGTGLLAIAGAMRRRFRGAESI
jgi:hypothetical protein